MLRPRAPRKGAKPPTPTVVFVAVLGQAARSLFSRTSPSSRIHSGCIAFESKTRLSFLLVVTHLMGPGWVRVAGFSDVGQCCTGRKASGVDGRHFGCLLPAARSSFSHTSPFSRIRSGCVAFESKTRLLFPFLQVSDSFDGSGLPDVQTMGGAVPAWFQEPRLRTPDP